MIIFKYLNNSINLNTDIQQLTFFHRIRNGRCGSTWTIYNDDFTMKRLYVYLIVNHNYKINNKTNNHVTYMIS